MKQILFSFGLIFLGACAHVPQEVDPKVTYKKELRFDVNGRACAGTCVVPQAQSYRFVVRSRGDMKLVKVTGCSFDTPYKEGGQKGWFAKDRKWEFTYTPDPDIAKHDCAVSISVYDSKMENVAFGYVDFEDPEKYELPATWTCNNETGYFGGVSVCESAQGAIQQLVFPSAVLGKPEKGCEFGMENSRGFVEGAEFIFECPSAGSCPYTFVERGGTNRMHRTTLFCYQQVLLGGN